MKLKKQAKAGILWKIEEKSRGSAGNAICMQNPFKTANLLQKVIKK